jgi:hypothetical protein
MARLLRYIHLRRGFFQHSGRAPADVKPLRQVGANRGTFPQETPADHVQHRMLVRTFSAIVGVAITLISGCGAEVPVSTTIPEPVVEALPLTVGVYYEPDFSNYTYSEKSSSTNWTIMLGDNTTRMFDRVLEKSFASVVRLDALPAEGTTQPGVDFLLKPTVDEYAFLTPEDSGVDFYSVSIRFQLNAYAPNGAPLDRWEINSYGRTRSKKLNARESMSSATDQALRDAAATMVLDFRQRPQIRALLAGTADK